MRRNATSAASRGSMGLFGLWIAVLDEQFLKIFTQAGPSAILRPGRIQDGTPVRFGSERRSEAAA